MAINGGTTLDYLIFAPWPLRWRFSRALQLKIRLQTQYPVMKKWFKKKTGGRKGGSSQEAGAQPRLLTATSMAVTESESSATLGNGSQVSTESPSEAAARSVAQAKGRTQTKSDEKAARGWWRTHRSTILASTQFILDTIDKGLDGMPIPGPKAAVSVMGGIVGAIRTTQENKEDIGEIAQHIESVIQSLAEFTVPTSLEPGLDFVSSGAVSRVKGFNTRLREIKTSALELTITKKNLAVRLMEAERVAQELSAVWEEIQREWSQLIAITVLNTERKVDGLQRRALLESLKPVESALHDSFDAAPSCLEDTRTQLLSDIAVWMADPAVERVYWLKGVAGIGKSAIAESVAKIAEERQCLLGGFFFSRTGAVERRSVAAVVPTLVYQLALKYGPFCSRVCDSIQSNPDIRWKPTDVQIKTLISDTFTDIPHSFSCPLLVIIDALDECDKKNGQEGGSLVPNLIVALQHLPFHVKLFITSRPESTIRNMFRHVDFRRVTTSLVLHHDIDEAVVREDIQRYLRHELHDLELARQIPVPPPFPLEDEFDTLVDRTDNLFIYARTVLEYLSSGVSEPRDQLEKLLRADPRKASYRFGRLDELYRQIVHGAYDRCKHHEVEPEEFRHVLASLVVLKNNLDVSALAVLSGIDVKDCRAIIRSLSSVLLCDDELIEPVRVVHSSFIEFITDPKRCTDNAYTADVPAYHLRLAERCLDVLRQLRQNICNIGTPGVPNFEVPDLDERLARFASMELRYACRFWHVHMQLAGKISAVLIRLLRDFCEEKLLCWVELLSLLDELPVILADMAPFLTYLESLDEIRDSRIYTLLTDLERLTEVYRVPVKSSALQIYNSALVTMPECCLLETVRNTGTPRLVSERHHGWRSMRKTLEGHEDEVTSVSFSGKSRMIVSGSTDKTVRIWDAMTGDQQHTMAGHEGWIKSVAFSPDGQWVASGSEDCTVRVWDAITGLERHEMIGHSACVVSVAFSPDSKLIVSGSYEHVVRVWDADTGLQQREITGHEGSVCCVAFSSDGGWIVTGSEDCTMRVWDARTGEQLQLLTSHHYEVRTVAVSPDGTWLASGSAKNALRVWNATTGDEQHHISDGETWTAIRSLVFSADSSSIISGSDDGSVRIWDVRTGQQRFRVTADSLWVSSVAISHDGRFIISGSQNGTVQMWDARINEDRYEIVGHDQQVNWVAFSPDGGMVVSTSLDSTICIWDANTGQQRTIITGHKTFIDIALFTPDGRYIVSAARDDTMQVWDTRTGKQQRQIGTNDSLITAITFSADGKLIISVSDYGVVAFWDLATGSQLRTLTIHSRLPIRAVALSPDGKWIVAGSSDEMVRLLDAKTGKQEHEMTEHYDPIVSVAFLSGGQYIISVDEGGEVYVWDTATGCLALDQDVAHEPIYRVNEGWIWRLGPALVWQRLCWLPVERRGTAYAYFGTKVCVGAEDGVTTILDFASMIPS